MAHNFLTFTIGDPIEDIWSYGGTYKQANGNERWLARYYESCPGGAANTYENIKAISGKPSWHWSDFPSKIHKLIRLCYAESLSEQGKVIELWDYIGNPKKMYRMPGGRRLFNTLWAECYKKGLVIADYNKGTVNRGTASKLPVFEFAMVDSRHRSVNLDWLKTSKVRIWHATGKEFDDEWGANFDYIIHTDGPNEVTILTGDRQTDSMAEVLPVPDTKPLDTVGAGDTLTAAITVWLTDLFEQNPEHVITFQNIVDATQFGIWCAQDVITKPRTAICSRTLEQYLDS